MNVPLCFRDNAANGLLSPSAVENSACESLATGLVLLPLSVPSPELDGGDRSTEGRRCDPPSLKMWTVSEAEEIHSSDDVVLKDMLKIRDGIEPRRNW